MKILETARTELREITTGDSAFFLALANSEGWLKYIGDRQLKTVDDASKYLASGVIKHYSDHGFGIWLVERRQDQEPLGICGLIRREGLENPDVGFAFLPEYHGQGYASETVEASLQYAATKIGLSELCAITLPDNTASIRVLQRAGFIFDRTIQLKEESLSLYSWQVPG